MEIRKLKILAIDDNPDNLISLNALIKEAFPEAVIFAAISGEIGLKLAVEEDPDVILLDIVMPEMDGFDVCRKLKADQRISDIPVVFVTALKGDKESRIKALECGGEAFLAKPIDESELTAQVRAMVKIKKANTDKRNENERLKRLVDERTASLQKELKERKNAEESLRESEERFRNIFAISPDAVAISEVETGIYVEVNASFEKMSGFTREEIMGKSSVDLGFWMEAEDRENYIQAIKKKGAVDNQEVSFRIKDESWIHTLVSSKIIKLSGRSLMLNVIKDITERKLNEKALKASEFQFREFFEKAADAIFIAEIETGTILDANKAATILMHRSHDELVGIQQSELHPTVNESYAIDTFKNHKELIKDKITSHALENTVLRADGTEVPVEILASSVNYHGKPCMMGTFRDITERKKAEELLRQSEYFFRESQRAAFVGSYKFELRNDFWSSSEVMNQIFGIDESYTRNFEGWLDLLHPNDREMMQQYFLNEVVAQHKSFNKEYRIIRKSDGETRWLLGLGKLDYDEQDLVVSMIGTIQDITERKQADEFNNSLLKTIPFGMDIVDEQGNILFQSENMESTFSKKAIGCKCWDLYRDDKSQCLECPLIKGIEIGETANYESKGVLGDRIFSISHTGMMFKGKKAMLEIFQDITDRKKSELALQESVQLFQGLFNASPDAIILIDPFHPTVSWPIVDCNEAACLMNGYTREEVIGQSIDLLNLKNGTPEEQLSYLNNLRKEPILHIDSFHRHKDGHAFPVEISTRLVTIGGREMVLGIDRDISERKHVELQLKYALNKAQESDRLKSAFLANMSHEIRTPLNSIIGFSELMTDPNFDADQQSEFAKIILNSGNSLLSIISDIMDFSKIEAGQIKVNKYPFVTQRLISQLQNEYALIAQGKGIELRIDLLNPKEDLRITSDENRLKQVLVNLVGNAIKFTKEGYVELGFKITGDCVQFRVSDTGIGIPKQFHNEIFERFRQVESADSRKYGGNGLGLAISKSLVEILGGEIWLESDHGKGSTFYLTIPIG
jgi:PAS domain S-box-containing protein